MPIASLSVVLSRATPHSLKHVTRPRLREHQCPEKFSVSLDLLLTRTHNTGRLAGSEKTMSIVQCENVLRRHDIRQFHRDLMDGSYFRQ